MIIEKAGLPTSADNFLHNLRSSTSQLHMQLEQLPVSVQLTSPQLSIENYIMYLRLMQAVINHTEKCIFPLVRNVVDDIKERAKSQFIQHDLDFLNVSSNTLQFKFDIDETNIATAMGIMYVIEGSALGGRFILKNVQAVLGLNEENGASYFAGYASKTGSMWKHFLNMLQIYQAKNKNEQAIIAGAKIAFLSIYNFMR